MLYIHNAWAEHSRFASHFVTVAKVAQKTGTERTLEKVCTEEQMGSELMALRVQTTGRAGSRGQRPRQSFPGWAFCSLGSWGVPRDRRTRISFPQAGRQAGRQMFQPCLGAGKCRDGVRAGSFEMLRVAAGRGSVYYPRA